MMKISSFWTCAAVAGALLASGVTSSRAESDLRRDYRARASDDEDRRAYREWRRNAHKYRHRYRDEDYNAPPPWIHRRAVRHNHRHFHRDRRGRRYSHRHPHVHDRYRAVSRRHDRDRDRHRHDHHRGVERRHDRHDRDHGIRHERVEPAPAPRAAVVVPASGFGRCDRDIIGAVIGGAAGAAVGSRIGKGDGRDLATIGGAIVGLLVGGSVGRSMDRVDQNCIGQALETAPNGRTVSWRNPDQRGEYWVTPVRTYQAEGGQYCREYTTKVVIDGRPQNAFGKACRQEDGSWKKTR